MPAFSFTEKHGAATKVPGSSRTRSAASTFEALLPVLGRFGITRLANITGLDDIGFPVWQAIRPNARSLSVAQGKARDHLGAKISAVMESLEAHHAEHARAPLRVESRRTLARDAEVVDATRLPLTTIARWDEDAVLPWTEARDLSTGAAVFVPFELVHSNFTLPRIEGSGYFRASSNGMGAGNHPAEAVLQGLCEVVERDAEALFRIRDAHATSRVARETVDDGEARVLLALLERAGIETMIWEMTSDIRLPCFSVVVFDLASDPDLNPRPAAEGSGCHIDRGTALCRALAEAMQSRLTSIAGSRDDLSTAKYDAWQSAESLRHWREQVSAPATRSFTEAPTTAAGSTVDDDLAAAVERLAERGLDRVFWVDLSSSDLDLTFARTIIPGLEGTIASPSYVPGARALARLES